MSEEEFEIKRYIVKAVVEWEVEVEAESAYDAEDLAKEYIQGDWSWALNPDYESYYAEEV